MLFIILIWILENKRLIAPMNTTKITQSDGIKNYFEFFMCFVYLCTYFFFFLNRRHIYFWNEIKWKDRIKKKILLSPIPFCSRPSGILTYILTHILLPNLAYKLVKVILFEINCTIFYTNLHELFCQIISWTTGQRYTYRVLQTIQMKLILLCVWAELAVLGSTETAPKFKYEI